MTIQAVIRRKMRNKRRWGNKNLISVDTIKEKNETNRQNKNLESHTIGPRKDIAPMELTATFLPRAAFLSIARSRDGAYP